MRNHVYMLPKRKASAFISINEWLSYFNVRTNHIEILAGQEIIIQLEPVQHVATDRFRKLFSTGRRYPAQ